MNMVGFDANDILFNYLDVINAITISSKYIVVSGRKSIKLFDLEQRIEVLQFKDVLEGSPSSINGKTT